METPHEAEERTFNGPVDFNPQSFLEPEVLNMIPTAIIGCDSEGNIAYFNDAAAEMWGTTLTAQNGSFSFGTWRKISDHNDIIYTNSPLFHAISERKPLDGIVAVERTDGKYLNIAVNVKPVFDSNGKISGAIATFIDVTKDTLGTDGDSYKNLSEVLERRIEERTATLKRSEERYHKMVEEVQDYAILLLNPEGFILNWNKGAEKIKGYTEAEIIGKNFRVFYQESDRIAQLPERLITEAHDTGRATHEGWRVRKDGTKFWGSVVITALHDEGNNVIGFSKVTRDLTERKLAEDQMNNYLRDIEFRNKQLEEYAYIASHDLQEPLRKIQVFAELLEGDLDNPDLAKKNLDKINASAKRMSNLIKDVLKYSQLSRTDEYYVQVDLNEIFNLVKEDYSLLIEQKGVKVKTDKLPVIVGIPIELNQLFSNLTSNAIKFSSEHPEIDIKSSVVKGSDTGYEDLIASRDYAKIVFSDNGVGFEQQYGDQVFKMFKRLSENAGTGIGLALCKKIVENHHGHIEVQSAPNVGTTFTIYLPVEQAQIV